MDDRSETRAGPGRDAQLFGPGPKRVLALSGGGVRGALSIAYLEALEAAIARREGRQVRLCEWFHLIAGTSTGAIIATALALGYRAADVRTLYERIGPRIFRRSFFRLLGLQAKFDAGLLSSELHAILGARTLDSEDLRTGLLVILKRMDTGSTWLMANNPRSAFWEAPSDASHIGNRHIPLARLVRASTAAPHFFDPELITIAESLPDGLFLDGGLTPHNNPALAALLLAALPAYGLNWPLGPEALTFVSVGTGFHRPTLTLARSRSLGAIGLAVRALAAQIADAEVLTQTLMTWLGQCTTPWPINGEIGDLGPLTPPFGHLFRYRHYDIVLDRAWLSRQLGAELSESEVARLRVMDDPRNIPRIYALGCAAAARQIRDADLG